jgi:hypothetical protein
MGTINEDRMQAARAKAQQSRQLGSANLTFSDQLNPKYLSDLDSKKHPTINESSETLSTIDRHVDQQQINPMLAAVKAKHADGVRTEFDLDHLPSAGVMKEFEAWKATLKKTSDGNLGDFYKYLGKHDGKDMPTAKDRQRLDHKLVYEEGMDEQLKQMGDHHLKTDVTLGLGNIDKHLEGHETGGHVNTKDPKVQSYLSTLEAKAALVAKNAADHGAARIELGNEPNNAPEMGNVPDLKKTSQATLADRYGLVEGSVYGAIKRNNDLHGMKVDVAAMMQMGDVTQTGAFLQNMYNSQQHYFGGHKQMLTDETNMHLYATRSMKQDGEHFDMNKAAETTDVYAKLMDKGILPRDVDVSEMGVYEASRLWSGDDKTGKYVKASADTNAVQGGDNYQMFDQLDDESEHRFNIKGVNMYGIGDANGYGPDRDTAITSIGHNSDLSYAGIGAR